MHTITPTMVITRTITIVATATGRTITSSSSLTLLLVESVAPSVTTGDEGHPLLVAGTDVELGVVESVKGVVTGCDLCTGLMTIPVVCECVGDLVSGS